jgi:hypothetical protein
LACRERFGVGGVYALSTTYELGLIRTDRGEFIDKGNVVLDVRHPDFGSGGAVGDGIADDTRAFEDAVTALGSSPGRILVPGGTYKVTRTIRVQYDRQYIVGMGKQHSIILFAPTAADTCFELHKSGSVMYQAGLRGLTFKSADTTYKKVAVNLRNVSEFDLKDVAVGPIGQWTGDDSIGLKIQGHELGSVQRVSVAADIPLSIEINPDFAAYDLDHWHFKDCYLLASASNNVIEVEDGCVLQNITFDGYQSWIGGANGFYWRNTVNPATSLNLALKGVRWEQPGDDGFAVDIDAALLGLTIDDAHTAQTTSNNGYRLRSVARVNMHSCIYGGTLVALDVDDTVTDLDATACFWQDASTVSGIGFNATTGMDIVWAASAGNALAPIPYTFHAESTDTNVNRHVKAGRWIEMGEVTDPSAPAAGFARIYARDNGGKTELVVRFATGAIQQLAIEP